MFMATQLEGFGAREVTTIAVPQGTGTAIGNMTAGGGLAAAFDGNTNQALAASAENLASTGYVGKTFGSPKTIFSAVATATNNGGFADSGSRTINLSVYGKLGSAPASGTDGTLLATTGNTTFTTSQVVTLTSTDQINGWDHCWLYVQNITGTAFTGVCELAFNEVI